MPQIHAPNTEARNRKNTTRKEAHHQSLRATIYSEASQLLKRQLDHLSIAGASSWLSARPLKESDLHLFKSDFRDLIRLRYLLSLENMLLTCVCSKDYTINHALICATGGFKIKRHNDVRDYLAHLLNQECADVSIEPHLVQVTEDETTSTNREDAARLDIAARDFWRSSQRAFFDIRVFNDNAQSNISRNIEETFSHHEREKARQYNNKIVNVEHGSFTQLIFSTHGDHSQLTSRFIYQLAKLISQKRNICFSESKSWLNSQLSNLVARLTILCIRGLGKIRPPNMEDRSIAVSNAQICWRNLYKPKLWMETTLLFIFFSCVLFFCWFYTWCCSYMYKG